MRIRTNVSAGAALCLVAAVATGALFLPGAMNSAAVQAPRISLDMAPAGNTYDETTNTITVGAVDHCLETAIPGNAVTHVHQTHLVIQDVEDLVAWQVRFNYIGDRMRVNTISFTPFTDNNTGQNIGFTNLPIDSTSSLHRTLTSAGGVGPAAPADGSNTAQTHLAGATYDGVQGFAISGDTPAKAVPDDTSYSAPSGGVLASVSLQVVGNEQGQQLSMDLDNDNPNPPGSRAVIFNGTGTTDINLAETALGDGSHAEGAVCQDPTPTPTAPPVTPPPTPQTVTPTPVPPAPACKCFNPQVSASYSSTAPGSHPSFGSMVALGLGPDGQPNTNDDTGDYNFAGVVNLSPSSPTDAQIPDSAILGTLTSATTHGFLNNSCTNEIALHFTMMEGTTDINNVVHMRPFGTGNELAALAGDNPPDDGQQAVKPPPAVTKYPSYLNAIFDHDWVDYGADRIPGNGDDNNGPSPPIRPRFRAVGTTWMATINVWVIMQEVVFEPGTDLPNLPAFDPSHGYPSVTVFQTSSAAGSATPPIQPTFTDACTPVWSARNSSGVTGDNPDTPANEGGLFLRTLPSQNGTQVTSIFYSFSERDADGDGYENPLDPCPFAFDAVWSPRDRTPPTEGDTDTTPAGPVSDGIPDSCDPTSEATGQQPTDHDDDRIPNRGDNCPLVANAGQEDGDRNANGEVVGDGIGDACDPNPSVPDGESIVCIKTITITVGGSGQATVSECMQTLPPPSTPTPTPTPSAPIPSLPCSLNPVGGPIGWTELAPLPQEREGMAGAIIGDRIYVTHGFSPFTGDTASVFVYNRLSNSWSTGANAGQPRAEVAGVCAEGSDGIGRVYAIGGRFGGVLSTNERYDPATNAWATMPPMPTARAGLCVTWVPTQNRIYVIGGRTGTAPNSGTPLSVNEQYNPVANTWSPRASMPVPMMDVYACLFHPGTGLVYVIGGYDGANQSNIVQRYDPVANAWLAPGAPMPTARSNAIAGICAGDIYVTGGYNGANLTVHERYDPVANNWSPSAAKPTPASEMASTAISTGAEIYAIGSGIFGASSSFNERFTCPAPPPGPCPPTPTTSTLSDVVLGIFEAKSEHKFKLNENPDTKMEKVAVEAGVKSSNLGREAYDVCLTLSDIPPNCTGRWRVVREETPGKFDRSDGNNDGLPDNLKFTKNGSLVDPITIYGGAPDKPIYLGPTGQAGDDISLRWRVLDVAPGEKVKVEPYMRYACSTVAERNYFFDAQVTPVGKTDHEPSDNVAVDTTRLVIETP